MSEQEEYNYSFIDQLRQNWWNVVLIGCFLVGQYFLIQYRVDTLENTLEKNNTKLLILVESNEQDIDRNYGRIHEIEVARAADIVEIRTLLNNLSQQLDQQRQLLEDRFNKTKGD